MPDVISYREDADGNHWDRYGNLLSTRAQREAAGPPQWKRFELGRIEEVDGHIVPGPNALPEDIQKYGGNVAKTNLHKTRPPEYIARISGAKMPAEKPIKFDPDWDIQTGWEKRLLVDFGTRDLHHPNRFQWTDKERDIIARLTHERAWFVAAHGPDSEAVQAWDTEHEQAMVGFAREGKPMPDWAHAGYRDTGIPDWVTLAWDAEAYRDSMVPEDHPRYKPIPQGAWIYDPPHPWDDAPASEAAEQAKPEEPMPEKPIKIMPDDPAYSPVEKALNWAAETHHGEAHQKRWDAVAAALGAANGSEAMTLAQAREWANHHGWNKRWSFAVEAIEALGVGATQATKKQVHQAQTAQAPAPDASGEIPQYRLQPNADYGTKPPPKGATGWYTRKVKWLPQWYWDLPALTHEEAEAMQPTSKASVAPMNYIYHKAGVGILGRLKPSPERLDLPIWTQDEAAAYYTRIGIKMRSVTWLDGHLMTRKGYSTTGDNRGEPIARAADEEYEAAHQVVSLPNEMVAAVKAGDWKLVAKLASERE